MKTSAITRFAGPLKALASVALSGAPALAFAGFSKPFNDVPDQLGTGLFAIDQQWTLFGLIGLLVVIVLLVGFSTRDK